MGGKEVTIFNGPCQSIAVLLPALCCAAVWAQPAPAPGTAPTPSATPAPEWILEENDINLGAPAAPTEQVERLIAQLGHPEYDVREHASQELSDHCPGAFKTLSRTYRESDELEIRLRIETIVRYQYLWHTLLKHNGFLGISYPPNGYTTLPDGSLAIHVSGVTNGSAAKLAGLHKGDFIRSIDGESFSTDPDARNFRDLIQEKGAGGKLMLEIMRGNRTEQLEVTLQARPIRNYVGDLQKPLNNRMQARAIWWDRFFGTRAEPTYRMPSTAVLEIPE